VRCKLESCGSGRSPVAGCCEHGNEHSSSIKGGEVLGQVSDYRFLKKGPVPWSSLLLEKFVEP
jgi:hypothetical protein